MDTHTVKFKVHVSADAAETFCYSRGCNRSSLFQRMRPDAAQTLFFLDDEDDVCAVTTPETLSDIFEAYGSTGICRFVRAADPADAQAQRQQVQRKLKKLRMKEVSRALSGKADDTKTADTAAEAPVKAQPTPAPVTTVPKAFPEPEAPSLVRPEAPACCATQASPKAPPLELVDAYNADGTAVPATGLDSVASAVSELLSALPGYPSSSCRVDGGLMDVDVRRLYREASTHACQLLGSFDDFGDKELLARAQALLSVCRKVAPNDFIAAYNYACSLALQGQDKLSAATDALQVAVECGYKDLKHLSQDPDLDYIRTHAAEAYGRIVARLEAQAQAAGETVSRAAGSPAAAAAAAAAVSPTAASAASPTACASPAGGAPADDGDAASVAVDEAPAAVDEAPAAPSPSTATPASPTADATPEDESDASSVDVVGCESDSPDGDVDVPAGAEMLVAMFAYMPTSVVVATYHESGENADLAAGRLLRMMQSSP